ncbi:Trypsin-like peptidase domain-containing protein [Streptomyces zhaozhouensis]|uniref:Trypsin-like peptidase domain-containing protein n=1 Tax=Streptomyces zhaozhouensis TaxID=1300267 RepID=A0A286DV80_9ACTN|nr:trypsin-like peptidase domain-containing protein [Streptomyces zhaozhouensis]SOD62503.1 Trypsin-like peptidase domain-containing protein [Streptomyces zhaozhouensis]
MNLVRLPIAVAAVVAALFVTAPPAVAADPWAQGTVNTVGKIIWEAGDGRLGLCSGAVVDAPNGSVVATAAHCVSARESPSAPGDVYFVPAYDHGRDSYRKDGWRVSAFHLPEEWDPNGETGAILPHDYAFLTLEPKDGVTVQEAVGANALRFEPVRESGEVAVLGYPAADPYDGESLRYCAGETNVLDENEAEPVNLGGLLLDGCDLTAGSSGGPWIQDYDAETESGTVVAVMSVGSGEGQVVGRPYPEAARPLLAAAGAEAAGDTLPAGPEVPLSDR